jgi:hypothetical protein
MSELIMRFHDPMSSPRGMFSSCVMARVRGDGSWEGWLEFTREADPMTRFATGIETQQHDRVALERWASGLTRVYAEGAFARARVLHPETPAAALLAALQEIVEALDRRIPHVERANESDIAADAKQLRAGALRRIASLRRDCLPQNGGTPAAEAGAGRP